MKKILTPIVFLVLLNTTGYAQCFTTLTSRYVHNIGLKTDGTIWGWGWGNWSQLSNTTDNDEASPIQIGNQNDWSIAVAGYYNTFAIKNNGTLWGTGGNEYGQLGLGYVTLNNTVHTMTQVGTATNWKQIAPGDGFTIGLRTDGTMWGWGQNDGNQVGDGTSINRTSPVPIGGGTTDWKMVAAGNLRQGFALKTNGTLWGWGINFSGMLGESTVQYFDVPTQLNTDTDWKTISLGTDHILALKTNGTLWAWGGGEYGQCADNLPLMYFRGSPSQVGTDSDWKVISAGDYTSYGIKTNGTLWAWGLNDVGQLGDGTTTNQDHPIQIGTDTNWASVSPGRQYVAALKTNGATITWGENPFGQLGNGTTTSNATPTAISITGCTLANEVFNDQKNTLSITPNPAQNELNLNYIGKEVINTVVIYDITGKEVFTSQPVAATSLMATFSIATLQSGNYLVVLKNNDKIILSKQLVKI